MWSQNIILYTLYRVIHQAQHSLSFFYLVSNTFIQILNIFYTTYGVFCDEIHFYFLNKNLNKNFWKMYVSNKKFKRVFF